jgi:acetyl-CoA synthetase
MAERHGVTRCSPARLRSGCCAASATMLPGATRGHGCGWSACRVSPLDPATFTWATERLGGGVPVINGYGQTETGSTWTYPVCGVDDLKAGEFQQPASWRRRH